MVVWWWWYIGIVSELGNKRKIYLGLKMHLHLQPQLLLTHYYYSSCPCGASGDVVTYCGGGSDMVRGVVSLMWLLSCSFLVLISDALKKKQYSK